VNALSRLFSMGISRSSLFPGLDGFCRSLGVYHSAFNREPWIRTSRSKQDQSVQPNRRLQRRRRSYAERRS